MRTRITLAMACFIGFVLCSAAVAYMPVLIIRECPHCKAYVVQEDTLSGNTIGAKVYTDGKREAKMLPDHPWLVRCPVCGGQFFVDEASASIRLKESPRSWLHQKKRFWIFWPGLPCPRRRSSTSDCVFGGRRTICGGAFQIQIRHFPRSKVKNLKALSLMLDESESGERILKAEIARELRNFDECLQLLSNQVNAGYEFAAGFIKKLAEDKVRAVKPFEPGK